MARLFRYLFLSLLVIGFSLVAAVAWLLGTQHGRDVVIAQVNKFTATLETPVVFGAVRGSVLQDFQIDFVRVGDAHGEWLSVDNARVVWHPWALVAGGTVFERVEAARILLARLPEMAAAPVEEKTTASSFDVAGVLPFVPENIRVDEIVVEAPVTGMYHRLRAEMAGVGGVQTISVSTLEGPVTSVSGTVVFKAVDMMAADIELREAAHGVIGGLAKLPVADTLSATIVASVQGDVIVADTVAIDAGASRIRVNGRGMRDGSAIEGKADVVLPRLADFDAWLQAGLRGKMQASANVSGNLSALGVGLVVSETTVDVSGTKVEGLNLRLDGTVDAVGINTPFTAVVKADGRVSGVGQGVYPLTIAVEANGTQAAVEASSSLVMQRRGESARIAVVGAGIVSPMTVSGTVNGEFVQGKHKFVMSGAAEVDPVQAVLRGVRVQGPGTRVNADMVLNLKDYLADGTAVVTVADLRPLGAIAGVDVRGTINANMTTEAKNGVQTGRADLRALRVIYEPYTVIMRSPAQLFGDGEKGRLTPLVVDVAGGIVRAQGAASKEAVTVDVEAAGLDLEKISDGNMSGVMNIIGRIRGKPDAPVVTVNGDVSTTYGMYPVKLDAEGTWRGETLAVKAVGHSSEASATAHVNLGGKLSLWPFAVDMGPESRLGGSIVANVPLGMFNPLLWASRMQVDGSLSGSATLRGTLGAPDVDGRFSLKDGSYSLASAGICLQGVNAEIVGARDRIVVENLTSRDAAGGTLAANVNLGLQNEKPLRADVALANFQLFCGGLATGVVDGRIDVRGVMADHRVAGKLTIGPLQVQLPGRSGESDIPQVQTVRVRENAGEDTDPAVITRLDVELDAPQRVYVRGRGMDAEFGGNIKVGGTASDPQLNGSLTATRGTFTLLDRTLQLADSAIRFEGPIPPSPYLAVKATTRAQGTDITLTVAGTATNPKITLSSDPALPSDEVLALLLFGRKLANISAFEALKLAQATRVLAGLDSGGPTLLDRARKTLRVDTLDIGGGNDANDVTVTTGKYLTDDVFLSVRQGTEPEDREVKTEIELTPSITGNTRIDGEGTQSIGIEWKHDY